MTPDLGQPSSYLACAPGIGVYSSDDVELGVVEHVLADPDVDVFDGIVIESPQLGGKRFVDASQVDEIYERGVVTTLDAEAAKGLPEPSANPAEMAAGPGETVPDNLHDKLRRAWDRISGADPRL